MREGATVRWRTRSNVDTLVGPKDERQRRALGLHLETHVCPAVSAVHHETTLRGARHRFARVTPVINKAAMRRFRSFCRVYYRSRMKDLPAKLRDTIMTGPMAWLAQSKYSEHDKQDMFTEYDQSRQYFCKASYATVRTDQDKRQSTHASFEKREAVGQCLTGADDIRQFKHARCIQGCPNFQKMHFGYIMHSIESVLFDWADPEIGRSPFCKHVKEEDQPEHIEECCAGSGKLVVTDHSAFEAHNSVAAERACVMQFYHLMTRGLACHDQFMDYFLTVRGLKTTCKFKFCTIRVKGCRMSGDLDTSLGNTLMNFMLMKHAAKAVGGYARGVAEGDDGLFRVSHKFPKEDFFANLGFDLKIAETSTPGEAGFCSKFWSNTHRPMREPIEFLARFGWSFSSCRHGGKKVTDGLLRAKAFSTAYSFGGCPILAAVAKTALRLTEGAKIRVEEFTWKQTEALGAFQDKGEGALIGKLTGVTLEDREMFFRLFNITPDEQELVEEHFQGLTNLEALTLPPCIETRMPASWARYAEYHVRHIPKGWSPGTAFEPVSNPVRIPGIFPEARRRRDNH